MREIGHEQQEILSQAFERKAGGEGDARDGGKKSDGSHFVMVASIEFRFVMQLGDREGMLAFPDCESTFVFDPALELRKWLEKIPNYPFQLTPPKRGPI